MSEIIPVITDPSPSFLETALGIPAAAVAGAATGAVALVQILGNGLARLVGDERSVIDNIANTTSALQAVDDVIGSQFAEVYRNNQTISDLGSVLIPGFAIGNALNRIRFGSQAMEKLALSSEKLSEALATRSTTASSLIGLPANYAQKAIVERQAAKLLAGDFEGLGKLLSKDRLAYALSSGGAWTLETAAAELGTIALQLNNPIYEDVESFTDALRTSFGTGIIFGGLAGGLRYAIGLKNVAYNGNETLGSLKKLGIENFEFLTSDGAVGGLAQFSPQKGALFASNVKYFNQTEQEIVADLRGLESQWAKKLPANLQQEWEAGLLPRARQVKNYYDANYASFIKDFADKDSAERLFRAIKNKELADTDVLSGVDRVQIPKLINDSWDFLLQPKAVEDRIKRINDFVKEGRIDNEAAVALRELVSKNNAAEIIATLAPKKSYEEFVAAMTALAKGPAKLPFTKKIIDTIWSFAQQNAWPKKVNAEDFVAPSRVAFLNVKTSELVRNPVDMRIGDFFRTEVGLEREALGNRETIVDFSRRELENAVAKAWGTRKLALDKEILLSLPNYNSNVDFLADFTSFERASPLSIQVGWEAAKRLEGLPKAIADIPIAEIKSPFIAYARWLNEEDPATKAMLRSQLDGLLGEMRANLLDMGLRPEQVKFLTNPENDFLSSSYLQVRLTDSPAYAQLDQYAAKTVAAQQSSDKIAAAIARSYAISAASVLKFDSDLVRYADMMDAARKTLKTDALNETGQGLLTNSTARASSLQAALQLSGQFINKVSQNVQKTLWERFLPIYQMAKKFTDDEIIELNLVHQKIMSTPLGWIKAMDEVRNMPVYAQRDSAKIVDGKTTFDVFFTIKNPGVDRFWTEVFELSTDLGRAAGELAGKKDIKPPIYFPQVRSSQRPWVAFVDEFASETVGASGFRQMVHARTEEELSQRVRTILETVGPKQLSVTTNSSNLKVEAKSLGEIVVDKRLKGLFDLKEAFSEFQVDSALKRSGRYGEYDPRQGTEIVDEYVEWLLASSKNFVRDTFKQAEIELFGQLEARSLALQPFAQSQKGKFYKENIDGFGDNAYSRMMRLALDYKPNERYEWISRWQSNAARVGNTALAQLHSLAQKGYENLDDKELADIANAYKGYANGLGLNAEKFTTEYLKTLPKSMQTPKYIERASQALNAFQATFHLGLDWFNALANAVSTPFVFSSAVRQFKADVGDGKMNSGLFAAKMLKEFFSNLDAIKALTDPSKASKAQIPPYLKELFDWGILNDGHRLILQDINKAMQIPATVAQGPSSWEKLKEYSSAAMRIAQEPTAKTELFSSYIAARYGQVMGERLGFPKEVQAVFANTLRQYATGGLIASQRPILFSGWLGNTFGLYKSFMLNVYQNSLQHIADGRMRDALALLGIQTFTFGVRGTLLGDVADKIIFDHYRNDYQGIDTAIPMNAVLYGAASAITQSNLFTRGDLTISKEFLNPFSVEAYAGISATLKTLGTIGQAANGDMSVSSAIQEILLRQQINRPLQRLTELYSGVRYDKNGKPMVFVENWSPWAIAIRGMGGAPLDESIAVDAYYRFTDKLWQNSKARKELTVATRKALMLDPEGIDWNEVVQNYVKYGGNPDSFRAWVTSLMQGVNEDAQIQMARRLKHTPALQFWMEQVD